MKKDVTVLCCFADDFCKMTQKEMLKHQISNKEKQKKATRTTGLTESEIMTIMLMFQESPYKNFKYFHNSFLQLYRPELPIMPTYERFITFMYYIVNHFAVLHSEKEQ